MIVNKSTGGSISRTTTFNSVDKYSARSRQSRKRVAKSVNCGIELLEGRTMFSGTPLYWNPSGGSGTWDTDPGNTPWHTASPTGPAVGVG